MFHFELFHKSQVLEQLIVNQCIGHLGITAIFILFVQSNECKQEKRKLVEINKRKKQKVFFTRWCFVCVRAGANGNIYRERISFSQFLFAASTPRNDFYFHLLHLLHLTQDFRQGRIK